MKAVVIAAAVVIGAGLYLWRRVGTAEYRLGETAVVRIPRRARLEPATGPTAEANGWVSFRLDRFHTWAMGSFTPYRSVLFLSIHEPGSTSYREALADGEGRLNGGGKDWRLVSSDDRWEIGSGIYDVNMLNEPTWRLEYRDSTRRVGVLWQVYQKDWDLDAAKRAILAMVESLVIVSEPDFAEIRDRPRRLAEENERKLAAAMDTLAARGFGTLTPGVPVTVNDVTVEYQTDPERRLVLFRLIGARLDSVPEVVTQGQRTWADSRWVDHNEGDRDYYPSPGIRALLADRLDRSRAYPYLIRTIRVDEVAAEDFRIAEFFEFATRQRGPAGQ
jgi:hypothetical protein